SDIESPLKDLIERYSPHDSAASTGQPWWHLPTDRLWRVLDSEGRVIRESGTSRGEQHVPSLEALRQLHGEFPAEIRDLLSQDSSRAGASSRSVRILMNPRSIWPGNTMESCTWRRSRALPRPTRRSSCALDSASFCGTGKRSIRLKATWFAQCWFRKDNQCP